MSSLLKLVFGVMFVLCIVHGQNECYIETQDEGICISLDDCDALKPLIKSSREKLKKYHCGFQGTTPKVCCPIAPRTSTTTTSTTTTISSSASPVIPSDGCITLEGTLGSCVALRFCRYMTEMLKTKSTESLNYVQRSRCIGKDPESISVCCNPSISPSSEIILKQGACTLSALPTGECCGIESSSGNKIIGGKEAQIDQFPWLALIEYARPQLCGGSLISGRYVLTAAHCIVNKANKPRGATAVRLGEYNTANNGRDCVEVEGGGRDCTLGSESIPIESAIAHADYGKDKVVAHANDIALIRLSRMATYNDFIRPICLPTSDITKTQIDKHLYVAGWGAVNLTQGTSDVKQYVDLPYVDLQTCRSSFNTLIWEKQICAGGEGDKDSCTGDSGGPLMYENGSKHEIIGIISFGFKQCGLTRPSIYTKVYDYLPWISSIVKP